MLKLNPGLFWLDLLPGVRVQVEPVSTAAYLLARHAARAAVEAGDADDTAEAQIKVDAHVAFTVALAERGIRAWEGVGDAQGQPVDPTPETIRQLLGHYPAFEAFDRLYVGPVVAEEAEKNVSSPSRTGSSATAKATAGDVETTETTDLGPADPATAAP